MNIHQQVLLFVAIGIAEYGLSWLNHRINLSVLTRKKNLATWQDLIANTLAEVIPFIIYVTTQNWIFIIPRVIGNTWGTRIVAGRPIKKKNGKKAASKKRMPFTSA